jgi:hypothetical protein
LTVPIDAAFRPENFTLVVPGFVPAWRRAGALGPLQLPALTRLVRRGTASRSTVAQPGWQPRHLRLLAPLGLGAEGRHGGALLEWLGLGGEPRRGSWLQAEFVHLEIGSHNARLHAITGLDAQAAQQLASVLQEGLRFPGLSLMPSPDPHGRPGIFLHSEGVLDALCPLPGFDDLIELRDVLPQGKDGPVLRRLLTEAQMLLHDHPVNADRERHKQRTANALWLTGVGEFCGLETASLPPLAGDGIYLKGLCRLYGRQALPVPASAAVAMSGALPKLVELPPLVDCDPVGQLQQLERDWFAPLASALRAGRISALLMQLDDLEVQIDRAAVRRFWRRGLTLKELLQ